MKKISQPFNKLVGLVIKSIKLGPDYIEPSLVFETDLGYFGYKTVGDCCSETYISEILFSVGLENKLKNQDYIGKVTKTEELSLKEWEYRPLKSRQYHDIVYADKIYIECIGEEDDSITIVYRNSSNWYYGGSLEFCDITDIKNGKIIKENYFSE